MSLELTLTLHRKRFTLDADLCLPGHGITAIFGRSGSGKTTLLRCIAGLEHLPQARVVFQQQIWQQDGQYLPTHKRPLGYVFQEASLFPHLRVLQNLNYGLKRIRPEQRRLALDQVISLFGLEELLQRYPDQISGGQRQRVALARALLTSPQLILMDEPMASLDMASKEEILPFIEKLRDELQLPILYVSHSIEEVTRLADHLVVLEQGRVLKQGPLQQLLTDPQLPFIQMETAASLVHGQVIKGPDTDGLSEVSLEGQSLLVTQSQCQQGQPIRIRILARDVVLARVPPQQISLLNCLKVELLDIQPDPLPSQRLLRLQLGRQTLLARISLHSTRQLALTPGDTLYALVKGAALH